MVNAGLRSLLAPISSLREDQRNARRHDERSIAAIMRSLDEFGQQKPIVGLEDGTIIAGNGTLEAARRLGWSEIAVVRFPDREKARAYAIADNRAAELSSWDGEALADALKELREDEIPLETVGFSDVDLERMLGADREVDPSSEWAGMPEFDQQDKTAARQIVVNFKSEEDAQRFGEVIGQHITDKTRSIWFPKAEIDRLMDKRYKAK